MGDHLKQILSQYVVVTLRVLTLIGYCGLISQLIDDVNIKTHTFDMYKHSSPYIPPLHPTAIVIDFKSSNIFHV